MTTGSKTADFLARGIGTSGKTQKEIAREVGFRRPNVLTMMKLGHTKIPINRIPAIARACGVDELQFVRLALEEYHPELFAVLLSTLGKSLTRSEWEVIGCYRTGTRGEGIAVDTAVKLRLIFLFQEIREKQDQGKWPPRHKR